MGFLRKLGKKIKKVFKKIGKALKKGFGKVAKAFGKLGPLGSIALSFLLPGIGNMLTGWLSHMGKFGKFIMQVGTKIKQGASWIKEGVGTVFNKVSDAIEWGMNAVSKPFMKEGARGMGSAFRDFISDATGGFIDKSTVGLRDAEGKLLTDANPFTKDGVLKDLDTSTEWKLKEGWDDPTSENWGQGERVAVSPDDVTKLSDIQTESKFFREQKAFMDKNMREITVKAGETPKLKSGEILVGSGDGGKYQVWKNEKALDSWTSGDFDIETRMADLASKSQTKVTDTSYSVWEGRTDSEQGITSFVKGSKEADVYKKVGALSTYGMTQMEGEAQIAAYNARVKRDRADYFTDAGLESLARQSSYSITQPQNFIDVTKFDIGKDLNKQYLESMNVHDFNISGFDIGGYGLGYEDLIERLAT